MIKDIFRKEDALPAYLYMKIIFTHVRDNPEFTDQYKLSIERLTAHIDKCFAGLTNKKRDQLLRSVDRTTTNIVSYFERNNFMIRKANLCITEWLVWMIRSQLIQLDRRGDLAKYLFSVRKVIRKVGYGEIEGFDKAHQSAINHVLKMHNIVIKEGYYL